MVLAPPCGGARGGWLTSWRAAWLAGLGRLGSLGWLGEARPRRPGRARPAKAARPESRSASQPDKKEKDGSRAGSLAGRLGEARPGRPGRAQPSQLLLPLAQNLDPAAPAWPSGLARCFSDAAGKVPGSNPGSAISARTPARGQGGQPEVDRGSPLWNLARQELFFL